MVSTAFTGELSTLLSLPCSSTPHLSPFISSLNLSLSYLHHTIDGISPLYVECLRLTQHCSIPWLDVGSVGECPRHCIRHSLPTQCLCHIRQGCSSLLKHLNVFLNTWKCSKVYPSHRSTLITKTVSAAALLGTKFPSKFLNQFN